MTFGEATVASVTRLNSEYTRVAVRSPLPEAWKVGDAAASLANNPDLTIRDCIFRSNRARGRLLGSRGRIPIENNAFHTPGAAILLEEDAHGWFEQAGVREPTIRGNLFENCNFGVWGKSVIEVGAGIEPEERAGSRYNRNVLIENNVFRMFISTCVVLAYSASGLTVKNNRYERSTAYPAKNLRAERFDIADSSDVRIEDPERPAEK